MTDDLWNRLVALVPDALEVAPDQRDAFLDDACRLPTGEIDAELRSEASALVAAALEADQRSSFRSPIAGLVDVVPYDEAPPETVGPWRVTGVLGEGGQGVVYRARRADGAFEREVAIKLLRPGSGSRVAARLADERRVLARLEHDGIARLYDGGLEDGRPYLAMELVEGQPITGAADALDLEVDGRAALLASVCDAVAFAHQRLVVHRDIKPSNVLVARDDAGRPRPKLLDFGVAKLLSEDDAPDWTVAGWMTPAYAAPEQVTRGEVTTATDVYALGVLAYEVLAGRRPYDTAGLSPSEVERVICRDVPPRPSEMAFRAAPSRTKALRGDLDVIVMKALAKEPERRYPTAAALADDLRRYLDGLPVEARPATARYRVGRFVQRHRAGVLGAVAAVLAVVAVSGIAFARVTAERDRAEASAAQAEETLVFLEGAFGLGNPAETDGDITLATALDTVAARVETIGDPAVAASVHLTLANAHLGRGSMDLASHHAHRALGLQPDDPVKAGLAHSALSQSLEGVGDLDTALAHSDSAVVLLRSKTDVEGVTGNLVGALSQRGIILTHLGRFEDGIETFREAESLAVSGSDSQLTALANLAVLYSQTGDFERSATMHGRIVEAYRRMGPGSEYEIALSLGNQGSALAELGPDYAERALELQTEGLRLAENILGPRHPHIVTARTTRAGLLATMDRSGEARTEITAALDIALVAFGSSDFTTAYAQSWAGRIECENGGDPALGLRLSQASRATRSGMVPEGHWLLSNADSVIGGCLLELGDRAQALPLLRDSHAAIAQALGEDHPRSREALRRLTRAEG